MTKHEEKALRISGDFFHISEDFFFFEGASRSLSRQQQKAKKKERERERFISKNENIIDTIDD